MIPKDGLRAILYGTGGKKLKMKRVTSYGTGDYQTLRALYLTLNAGMKARTANGQEAILKLL